MTESKCINCNINPATKYSKYSSGNFCSKACANSFSTKGKRTEINKKVSDKLSGRDNGGVKIEMTCPTCDTMFVVKQQKKNQKYCSSECVKGCPTYRQQVSDRQVIRCGDINERLRLKEIGRKGGFGTKGYTDGGTYYQSILEKKAFEFLEESAIIFEAHKGLPDSSKVSDIFINGVWVELDGIDREKKKKWIGKDYQYWLEKLEEYKSKGLPVVVFKNITEFKIYFNKYLESEKNG